MPYITVRTKFVITLVVSTLWMAISIWLSIPWHEQLSSHVGEAVALFLIGFIAIVPAFMNAFLIVAMALETTPPLSCAIYCPSSPTSA